MRMLVPVVQCDGCKTDLPPESVPDEVAMSIGGKKDVLSADLCNSCRLDFSTKLRDVVNQYMTSGRVHFQRQDKQPTSSADKHYRTCKICSTTCPTRGALGQHLKIKHDSNLKQGAHPLPKKGQS